ncbi:MAG: general secretion pathway protein GspB [Pseudomonadota bacterium]|nr:general secretion pathway protein GspB [Pseudomonadota bacterium]
MSYILEALKKSEQQREIGHVPGISSVHENTAKSVTGNWLWLIVTVLLLNAGLLVLLLWPESESEPESATLSAPVREQPVQVQQHRPAGESLVSQPPPVEKPVPRVPQTADIAQLPESPAAEPVKTETAAKPLVQEPVIAAASAASPAQPQVVQPPRPPVKAAPSALPVWPQIPTHLFQQLSGNLRLDVHVFSDQPQKRFVLINMKKYKQGEKLQEGPQLDEITPEGAILSFHGQRFRLQAQ